MPFLRYCRAAGHFRCKRWTDCVSFCFISPYPTPLSAFGASILAPLALGTRLLRRLVVDAFGVVDSAPKASKVEPSVRRAGYGPATSPHFRFIYMAYSTLSLRQLRFLLNLSILTYYTLSQLRYVTLQRNPLMGMGTVMVWMGGARDKIIYRVIICQLCPAQRLYVAQNTHMNIVT